MTQAEASRGIAMARDISRAAHGIAAITQEAKDDRDVNTLAYVGLYACGFAGGGQDLERYRTLAGHAVDDGFVARLRLEVVDTVEMGGWTLTGRDDGRVLVEKQGMRAFVSPDELAEVTDVGRPVTLRVPALQLGRLPGFVLRMGRTPLQPRSHLTRFYVNIKPGFAGWALGHLGRRLDAAGVPYELKVLAHPRTYVRRDPCVLYVRSAHEAQVIRLLSQAINELPSGAVRGTAPRLTGRVMPGVNLAHEPTDMSTAGISHGQWVAGLFCEAAKVTRDPRAIAARVRTLIAEAGRDPRQPHLRGDAG